MTEKRTKFCLSLFISTCRQPINVVIEFTDMA